MFTITIIFTIMAITVLTYLTAMLISSLKNEETLVLDMVLTTAGIVGGVGIGLFVCILF